MASILSQEEIDALLASARTISRTAAGKDGEAKPAVPYNFRRPDRVSKEQIRSIYLLHDRFARDIGTSLSAYLRIGTEVSIISVDTLTYGEFLGSLPDPTLVYSLDLPPVDGLGALELNPAVASVMVDRMLGGRGSSQPSGRALTEIEQNVVDAVVRLILENLTAAWRRIVEVAFKVRVRETRPQILNVAAPGDLMVGVVFEVRVGEVKGLLNLCLPASLGSSVPTGWQTARREPTPAELKHLWRNLARVRVPLTAVLRSELEARDLLALRAGEVITLGCKVRDPIEVRAWNTVKLLARPTRTENGPGLRIGSWVGATEGEARK